MTTSRTALRRVAVTGAAFSLLTLAACTSGGGTHTSSVSSSASGAPASRTSSAAAQGVQPVQHPVPTSVANTVALRRDVAVHRCSADGKGWQASGTVDNSAKAGHVYRITVFFTTPHATVQDFATTSVSVRPGKSATWTARRTFTAVKGTQCVLRGVG